MEPAAALGLLVDFPPPGSLAVFSLGFPVRLKLRGPAACITAILLPAETASADVENQTTPVTLDFYELDQWHGDSGLQPAGSHDYDGDSSRVGFRRHWRLSAKGPKRELRAFFYVADKGSGITLRQSATH